MNYYEFILIKLKFEVIVEDLHIRIYETNIILYTYYIIYYKIGKLQYESWKKIGISLSA